MATYRQFRAPADDDTALADPPWPAMRDRLRNPPERPALEVAGRPLEDLRREAREALVAAAIDHTGRYAAIDRARLLEAFRAGPLVVSGHQPELFHPGVWFKNFALDRLAKASGGVGVHLLIDSDLCREPTVLSPTGSVSAPRVTAVPYDTPLESAPHEERRVADRGVFLSFAERVADAVRPLVADPLAPALWRDADDALGRTVNLGLALSEMRHRVERDWGAATLEAPASAVCDSAPFRLFAAELLVRHAEVADAYNAALADYRAAHRLRNEAQPLPDLHTIDAWREAPLWVWSVDDPRRRPLFVRRVADGLELSDRERWRETGPGGVDAVADWIGDLRERGVKLRSRALVTTLYARLVLADLFLHGIGGAKYDQVTDRFAERLFGAAPPAHATLSATLRLPIDHDSPTEADVRGLKQRLRDLRYHPERFAPDEPAAAAKRRWVETPKTPANAAERHRAIESANEALRRVVEDERRRVEGELEAARSGLRGGTILTSREYSFCLFPAENVRERLTRLAAPIGV